MSKLKEEELLGRLERIVKPAMCHLKYWNKKDEQAHQQIREMILAYAEHQELTANYIDIVIDLYDQLEQKKPEVTEEFVGKWADKFDNFIYEHPGLIIDIDLLKQLLKEAGVKIKGGGEIE